MSVQAMRGDGRGARRQRALLEQISARSARLLSSLAGGNTVAGAAIEADMPLDTARSDVKRLRELTGAANVLLLRAWWVANAASWAALMASYSQIG